MSTSPVEGGARAGYRAREQEYVLPDISCLGPQPGKALQPTCNAAHRIRLGSQSEMAGKAIRMASRTTSATMNGSTPWKSVRVGTCGSSAFEHEQVHADGRADQADLHHHDDQDAEPDRIEAQVHDEREEHRHRQQDHGELLHRRAEDDVDRADRRHHHDRRQVERGDQGLQIARHRRVVDELGKHQRAGQDGEQHRRRARRFHQRVEQRAPGQRPPRQREAQRPERAHARAFGGREDAAVDAAHHHDEEHRDRPHILERARAAGPRWSARRAGRRRDPSTRSTARQCTAARWRAGPAGCRRRTACRCWSRSSRRRSP